MRWRIEGRKNTSFTLFSSLIIKKKIYKKKTFEGVVSGKSVCERKVSNESRTRSEKLYKVDASKSEGDTERKGVSTS